MSLHRALPRVCIALGFSDVETLLKHAAAEIESGERFFEFRLADLPDPDAGVQAIPEFLKSHPEATILATCRRHQNQGRYNGSIEEQIRILSGAVRKGAAAVDVEIESAESLPAGLEDLQSRA